MRQRRQLFFYLLLNVIVSACVTGTILFFYDRAYRPAAATVFTPTQPALNVSVDANIEIVSIIGAGAASSEIVVIQNKGEEAVLLTDWFLQDGGGDLYTFPQLSLNPGGTVQVHTASGTNTAIDLYWGRVSSVWRSGGMARLYDPQGNERAQYSIP